METSEIGDEDSELSIELERNTSRQSVSVLWKRQHRYIDLLGLTRLTSCVWMTARLTSKSSISRHSFTNIIQASMSTTRISIDGLWRCLCPSIDAIAVRAYFQIARPLSRPRIAKDYASTSRSLHSYTRQHATTLALAQKPVRCLPRGPGIRHQSFSDETIHNGMPRGMPPNEFFEDIKSLSTPQVYEVLRRAVTEADSYHKICGIVDHLITVRKEEPSAVHYDALIRANSDAFNGSVKSVQHLLAEMQATGISTDSRICHGVLQVLAIHPDYAVRAEILQEMKERWFGLSPEGWHHLVLGLLRDRQYETAMDKIEQMQNDGIVVQNWLYDIFMFQLAEMEEHDEAFALLRRRWEKSSFAIQQSVWYLMLDAFGRALHYDGVKFIWDQRVAQSYLTPSDGMCGTALNIAARFADTELGTSAIQILASRSAVSVHHYEALIEAYVKSGDIKTAFQILTIMNKARMELDASNTRSLYTHFVHISASRESGWQTLIELQREGYTIPLAAVHVILEACVKDDCIDQAIALYKVLHELVPSGPSTSTFNALLIGLTHQKDIAMFIAAEMATLGIPANKLTYDRLIMICLQQNKEGYEDAFKYLEEMEAEGKDKKGGEGWWMGQATAQEMVSLCVARNDPRAWGILKEMERRGMKCNHLKTWVEENWKAPKTDGEEKGKHEVRHDKKSE